MFCISFQLPPVAAVTGSPLEEHHRALAASRYGDAGDEEDEELPVETLVGDKRKGGAKAEGHESVKKSKP